MAGHGVLVALSGAPSSPALLRRAASIAERQHFGLVGVFVRTTDDPLDPPSGPAPLAQQRSDLEALGGRYLEVSGEDVADALIRVATSEGLSQIVIGASHRSRWQELRSGSVVGELVQRSPVDVVVVGGIDGAAKAGRPLTLQRSLPPIERRRRQLGWILAIVAPAVAAAVLVAAGHRVDLAADLVIMLLAVLGAAAVGGLGPGATAALWANLLANWWFIPPINGLSISRAEDALALTAFLVVALVIGSAVSTSARRTSDARRARADAAALAALAGTAAASRDPVAALVEQLRIATGARRAWLRSVDEPDPDDESRDDSGVDSSEERHLTLPVDEHSEVGLLGTHLRGLDPDITAAFLHQLALAIEQRRLRAAEEDAHRVAQVNDLRATLLAAVSHDLRTPLATFKAASSSLVQLAGALAPEDRIELARSVEAGVDRLTAVVTNLLEMSRIRAGAVDLDLRPVQVDEVVHRAVLAVAHRGVRVEVGLDDDLPPVHADAALLEHVVTNLLDNACKWSPAGARVDVDALLLPSSQPGSDLSPPDTLVLRVIDRGPGIAVEDRARVRLAFERANTSPVDTDAPYDSAGIEGTGLGLSVATGFCSLMGITLVLDDTTPSLAPPGGGTTASLYIPLSPAPGGAERAGAARGADRTQRSHRARGAVSPESHLSAEPTADDSTLGGSTASRS